MSERLNYSALHGLRHGHSMGGGVFGGHFLGGYNHRSIMSTNPIQSLTSPNMILYNASNGLRPFPAPTSASPLFHHLSSDYGVLAAAGSSPTSNAAAIAMHAAATQAASYQSSLKSAAHLLHEMKSTRHDSTTATSSSSMILASLSHQQGSLNRHSFLPSIASELTSSNLSSTPPRKYSPPDLSATRINFLRDSKDASSK